ncbi:DUF1186 domain-containing protein [Uliginosibacterium sp. H1]|uniref:DUF1186 domain-containing protein n=1 Tax=Uliginosibacterium sp. H1 TaxID=3114757 RepID=UPI002E19BF3F|nr:DUF1186 domain-containing protein [Uliginosibacterium sp. H1]
MTPPAAPTSTATPASAFADWPALRTALERTDGRYPAAAVDALRADRARYLPDMLVELERLAADPSPLLADADVILHFHLIALLAEFREAAALAPVIALARRGDEDIEAIFGDFVGELLGRALASLAAGRTDELSALAGDAGVDPWVRSAAVEAIAVLALEGNLPHDEAVRRILAVGEAAAAQASGDGPDTLVTLIAGTLGDMAAADALPTVRDWFARGLVDPQARGELAAIEPEFAVPLEERRRQLQALKRGYVTSASEALAEWPMFKLPAAVGDVLHIDNGTPYARTDARVGRNDPCPCGSGKKYKKCCGA